MRHLSVETGYEQEEGKRGTGAGIVEMANGSSRVKRVFTGAHVVCGVKVSTKWVGHMERRADLIDDDVVVVEKRWKLSATEVLMRYLEMGSWKFQLIATR